MQYYMKVLCIVYINLFIFHNDEQILYTAALEQEPKFVDSLNTAASKKKQDTPTKRSHVNKDHSRTNAIFRRDKI